MTLPRNYDMSALMVESDERGFIIGESRLGEGILLSSAGSWVDIKDDFTSIEIERSVTIDGGVFFRPEASSLTLTTKDTSYGTDAYNKAIRVRYAPNIPVVIDSSYGDDGAAWSFDTGTFHSSPRSRKFVGNDAAYSDYASTTSGLVGGDTLNVSYWVNVPVATPALSTHLTFYDSVGAVIASHDFPLAETDGWEQVTTNVEVPSGTDYTIVWALYADDLPPAGETYWLDDIQLTSSPPPLTLFNGTIRNVQVIAKSGDAHEPVEYRLQVEARDSVETLNNLVWYNFTASQETAAQRAVRAWPDAQTASMTRLMPARSGESVTALEALQDAADAALARFYVDANNKVILDASVPTEPQMTFSDVHRSYVPNQFNDWSIFTSISDLGESSTQALFGPTSRKFQTNDGVPSGVSAYLSQTMAGERQFASLSVFAGSNINAELRLVFLDGSGEVSHATTGVLALPSAAWQTLSVTGLTPADASEVKLELLFPSAASTTLYVDGVVSTEGVAVRFEDLIPVEQSGAYAKHGCYNDLAMVNNIDNTVTSVVAVAKSDETKSATRTLSGAVVTNQKRFDVDILTDSLSMNAWVESFPLRATTSLEPRSMKPKFSYPVLGLDLCDLINVELQGDVYEAGIASIKHSITPEHWNVSYDLVPGHVVRHSNVVAPGNPVNFRTTARTHNSVSLAWQAPAATGTMTGYELRYKVGSTPPVSRTDGMLLATLPVTTTTYNHTGLTSMRDYSYALFSTTSAPTVFGKTTHGSWTIPQAPSNPPSVTTSKPATTSIKVDWTAPTTRGDLQEYEVAWSASGVAGSAIRVPAGTLTYTITGLVRNKSYTVTVKALSKAWKGQQWVNSGTTGTANTNETVPSKATSVFIRSVYTAPRVYGRYVEFHAPTTPGPDFAGYTVRYAIGTTAPGLGTGTKWGDYPASATGSSYKTFASGTTITVAVWAKTIGGLYGPVETKTVTLP